MYRHNVYPHKSARESYLKPSCSLCVTTFIAFGAILVESSPDGRLEQPILVQMFTTPHLNKVLLHSRVDRRVPPLSLRGFPGLGVLQMPRRVCHKALSFSIYLSLSLSLCVSLFLSLSLSHTHTHTHTYATQTIAPLNVKLESNE